MEDLNPDKSNVLAESHSFVLLFAGVRERWDTPMTGKHEPHPH